MRSRIRVIGTRRDGRPIYMIAGGDGTGDRQDTPQAQQGQSPYRTLQEIEDRQQAIRSELGKLDQLDAPDQTDLDFQGTLIGEFDELEGRAAPLRRRMQDVERVMRARSNPDNREDGVQRTRQQVAPDLVTKSFSDPYDGLDMDRVRLGMVPVSELHSRALDLVERDAKRYQMHHDHAETASVRSQGNHHIAAHILLTGTQEYREVFQAYLRDPEGQRQRAALSLTLANGGYLLPFILDPTLVLTNTGSRNPVRRYARGEQTTSNAWQGVNSAGVNAGWLDEGTVASDNSPTVGQIQIFPKKGAAWVFGSFEAISDEDWAQQLPPLFSDARDRLEADAFILGTGGTNNAGQPSGVVFSLGTGNVVKSGTGGALAVAQDVYNLQAALPPRFRDNGATWLGDLSRINKIRGLDTAGGSSFWANFGQGQPPNLLDSPISEASSMSTLGTASPTTATTGTANAALLYGDFKQFIVVDRVGASMIYEPLLKGTGANAALPTGQAGWFYLWRVGSGVSTTAAFRILTHNA